MLPREFYARDAELVAQALIGCQLVIADGAKGDGWHVRIVETEAYVGSHDLASHSSKGRTKRTEVMFGPAGHAYVYLIYGMYNMLNIVTGQVGEGQAVLIRGVEVIQSLHKIDVMSLKTDGPGKLCKVLGITRDHNGQDLQSSGLYLTRGRSPTKLAVSPRIGIDYAGDWKDAPLRFFDPDSQQVSKPKKAMSYIDAPSLLDDNHCYI
ncbi:MAG: DNA-3-methyladenine glycosylase [Deinococcota bacterium]